MKQPDDTDVSNAWRAARLRYVSDDMPGIRRRRRGRGFSYTGPDGAPIRDDVTLARIRSLAIPPAWESVWICARPDGHLQATGRDSKGRKQYRYHSRWRELRDEAKFDRVVPFANALPRIHATVAEHLSLRGTPREKVLATVVFLLETSLIRIGNDAYATQNRSFGLTTLRTRHVDISGSRIHFSFRGKGGVHHEVDVTDRRVATILRRLRDLPGQALFQYVDEDGERHNIASDDVNAYLHNLTGEEFTAKDFRTWAGTMLAAQALASAGPFESETQARHNIVVAMTNVAARLGNTPAVCRTSYVHPAIIDAYLAGRLPSPSTSGDDDACFEHAIIRLLSS